jgi:hypothetical protein
MNFAPTNTQTVESLREPFQNSLELWGRHALVNLAKLWRSQRAMQIEDHFRFSLTFSTYHVDVSGPMVVRIDDDTVPTVPKDCCHSTYIAKPKRLGNVPFKPFC